MSDMSVGQEALVKEISAPLFQSKGWMKLIAVLSIIYGAIIALSIVGIVVAWLPIWMGVLLFQSASTIEQAMQSGQKALVLESMQKLRLYFTITGVVTLLALIAGAIGMVAALIAGGSFFDAMNF